MKLAMHKPLSIILQRYAYPSIMPSFNYMASRALADAYIGLRREYSKFVHNTLTQPPHKLSHYHPAYILERYATKLSGIFSLPGSIALGGLGLHTENPAFIMCSALSITSDAIKILYGDTHNLCSDAFNLKDALNPRKSPHQSSTAIDSLSGALMAAAGFGTNTPTTQDTGWMIAGGMDMAANAVVFFIPERKTPIKNFRYRVLNLPGVKNFANYLMIRSPELSSKISLLGLGYLGLHDIIRNGGHLPETASTAIIVAASGVASEWFYGFSQKNPTTPWIITSPAEENRKPENPIDPGPRIS